MAISSIYIHSAEISEDLIADPRKSIESFIEKAGVGCNIVSGTGIEDGGYLVYNSKAIFTRAGEIPAESLIEAGDIIEVADEKALVIGKNQVPFKDVIVKYLLEMLVCNALCDFLRHSEARDDDYNLQITWEVVASGIYGFQTDLAPASLEPGGKFGGLIFEPNEFYIPGTVSIQHGDRFQPMKWMAGQGQITASGMDVTGNHTNFTDILYPGGKIYVNHQARIINDINDDMHCTVTEPFEELHTALYDFLFLEKDGIPLMVTGIKDKSTENRNITVLSLAEDTRA